MFKRYKELLVEKIAIDAEIRRYRIKEARSSAVIVQQLYKEHKHAPKVFAQLKKLEEMIANQANRFVTDHYEIDACLDDIEDLVSEIN